MGQPISDNLSFMRIFIFLILMFVLGLLALMLLPDGPRETESPDTPPFPLETVQKNIRNVAPSETLPGPVITQDQITRLPAVVAPALIQKQKSPDSDFRRNVLVTAAGVMVFEEHEFHIAGILPLELAAECKTDAGEIWPCGKFARTALRALIGARAIRCDQLTEFDNVKFSKCRVGNRDIGAWLVLRGWAKDADGSYIDQMRMAKDAQAGMWRTTLP